jgi:hypothetical protein
VEWFASGRTAVSVAEEAAGNRRLSWTGHRNVSGFLYGTLVTGAVVAVASAVSDSAMTVGLAVVHVAIVYWVAHVYVRVLADRLADPSATFVRRARESFGHEAAVLEGGVPALAVFVLAAVLGADASRAADLALLATVGLLASAGYAIGRQAKARGWALAGEVAAATLLGLAIVGLKTGLH